MTEIEQQLVKLQNLHAETNIECGALGAILQNNGVQITEAQEIFDSCALLAMAITDLLNKLET